MPSSYSTAVGCESDLCGSYATLRRTCTVYYDSFSVYAHEDFFTSAAVISASCKANEWWSCSIYRNHLRKCSFASWNHDGTMSDGSSERVVAALLSFTVKVDVNNAPVSCKPVATRISHKPVRSADCKHVCTGVAFHHQLLVNTLFVGYFPYRAEGLIEIFNLFGCLQSTI